MGLLAPLAEFIVLEHAYRRIAGDVLFIGRQTVYLTEETLHTLLARYGLRNEAPAGTVEFDTETLGARGHRLITDRYFMRALGVQNVRFMDVTAYENADIVHDLGYPVDQSLHQRFDFIYNGGCLDNMFNPGIAIMNMSSMLRPGGRIVCMESASSWNRPYLMYSPGWFYDYFTANGYADCKTYIASYVTNEELWFGPWRLFSVNIDYERNGAAPRSHNGKTNLLVLSIAEKGLFSTSSKQPIQYQYRLDPKWRAEFEQNERAMRTSTRPLLGTAPTSYLHFAGLLGKALGHSAPASGTASR